MAGCCAAGPVSPTCAMPSLVAISTPRSVASRAAAQPAGGGRSPHSPAFQVAAPEPKSPSWTGLLPVYLARATARARRTTGSGIASGHADDLPGDVARLLSGEEGDDLGDLVGLGQVPERARGYGGPLDLGSDPPGVRGGWLHHVGGDPVGSQFLRRRHRVVVERSFGRAVGNLLGEPAWTSRREADDAAPARAALDVPPGELRAQQGRRPGVHGHPHGPPV